MDVLEVESLKGQLSDLVSQLNSARREIHLLMQLNIDACETDTYIRKVAGQVLTDFKINGDSFGVPTLEDIVDQLVNKIKSYECKNARYI